MDPDDYTYLPTPSDAWEEFAVYHTDDGRSVRVKKASDGGWYPSGKCEKRTPVALPTLAKDNSRLQWLTTGHRA